MTLSIKQTLRNTMLDIPADALDVSGPGKIAIYSGTRPTNVDTALSGNTKLAEFTLANPACASAASGAVALAGTPLTTTAVAGSPTTATFFRAVDGAGTVVADGSVGTSGADLNLSSTSITAGQSVSITSGNFAALAG